MNSRISRKTQQQLIEATRQAVTAIKKGKTIYQTATLTFSAGLSSVAGWQDLFFSYKYF